jgi:hypothetical protein
LSPSEGQVSHVLLTRAPLSTYPKTGFSFDLHVLGTPPAFILSQDQTLHRLFFRLLTADGSLTGSALLASCHSAVVKLLLIRTFDGGQQKRRVSLTHSAGAKAL